MEKSVNGIRGRFYYDLKKDYRERKEQVREAYLQLPEKPKELLRVHLPQLPEEIGQQLKEHFAQLPEELKKLLEERFPWLLEEDLQWVAYEAQIRKQLREAVRKRSGGVLQRKAPEEERERRDFWEELWLYDAGREEGLISDREYYLWLLEYLAARSACYQVYYYYHDSRKDRDENLDESIKEDGRAAAGSETPGEHGRRDGLSALADREAEAEGGPYQDQELAAGQRVSPRE